MHADFETWMGQFAAVLTRVSSALAFVPLPGLHQSTLAPRAGLSFVLALILTPVAMSNLARTELRTLAGSIWNLPLEAAMGLAAGVGVGWLLEGFILGMQLISIQAGYSFASTIDPATQADSGVLLVAGQLAAGLLFVTLGWEREVLAAFAASLDRAPPGTWQLQPGMAMLAAQWTGAAVILALRLAFPVMAFLLLLDLSLALLGRTQPLMPLVNLALPVKMGATLVLLALQSNVLPGMLKKATGSLGELFGRFGITG